jgi:hypothetical protein
MACVGIDQNNRTDQSPRALLRYLFRQKQHFPSLSNIAISKHTTWTAIPPIRCRIIATANKNVVTQNTNRMYQSIGMAFEQLYRRLGDISGRHCLIVTDCNCVCVCVCVRERERTSRLSCCFPFTSSHHIITSSHHHIVTSSSIRQSHHPIPRRTCERCHR